MACLYMGMTLDEYLVAEKITETVFAKKAKLTQAHINRLRKGLSWPQKDTLTRIMIASDGKITPNDFLRTGAAA